MRTPGYLIDGEYFSASDLATKQPATAEALKRYEKTLDDLARSIDDPLNPQATSTLFALTRSTSPPGWTNCNCRPPPVS